MDDRRAARLRADLLDLGVTAVMSRATTLGDSLVVPSHVVVTLPADELSSVDGAAVRAELAAAVRTAVRRRRPDDAAVIGEADLRVTLVVGEVREVDARFESSGPGPGPGDGGADAGRDGTAAARVVDDPRQPFDPLWRSVP